MTKLTPEQIVVVLEALQDHYYGHDDVVRAERQKIRDKYAELRIKHPQGFTSASIEARAWWLRENVLGKPQG